MRVLYIFPHPDDESFGPAAAMWKQKKAGHEVFLLTLTKGEATKQRLSLGVSKQKMGEIRFNEMKEVAKVLELNGMDVWNFPDGQLCELDPRELEKAIEKHICMLKPDVIVSYPVHGISGFHDHLVMHAVIKRLFLEMIDKGVDYLKRLAFFTLPDNPSQPSMQDGFFRMKLSPPQFIDCIITLDTEDIAKLEQALNCYVTYQQTIKAVGVVEKIGNKVYFEFFGEDFQEPVDDLFYFIH
jgi:N-acetylglucosamine malate deacetylase 2